MSGVFDLTGRAAPPMVNGEVLFEAPWQGRVFGMAHRLAEQGVFPWDDFRARLIERIAAWEQSAPAGAAYPYYDCFLEALESLLLGSGLLDSQALETARSRIEAQPSGHDHDHDHDHHH